MQTEGNQKDLLRVASTFNRDEKENEVKQRAEKLGLPYYDLRMVELAPDTLSLVSKEEAANGIIPLVRKGDKLIIGLADPKKEELQQIVEYLSRFLKVTVAMISWEAVKDALPHFDGLVKQVLEKSRDYEIEAFSAPMTFEELTSQINSAPIQDILRFIVSMAIQVNSSDIHLEPQREGARVRFRIDGVLHIVGNLVPERFKYILSQIELSSGLKLNVNEAQEGRLEVKLKGTNNFADEGGPENGDQNRTTSGEQGRAISVRVETMPTLYGDDISLRIFNTEASLLTLDQLGLYPYSKDVLKNALTRPQGMILVVGPTGSGKTSTIYAVLNVLNRPEVKIITLEDPIEYALPGITQSQINEGESFFDRLKAVLREDPDIVMVGEIRDGETADVALHAALTGHLMISTFHANNAVTALGLLKEIAGNNRLLASAVNLLIAQRLVRKLCPKCKKEHQLSEEEKIFAERLTKELQIEDKPKPFFEAAGCDDCNGLGYKGRIAIFEMLPLSLELQKLVTRDDITMTELQESAKKSGMVTMEQDGLIKAQDGLTSLSEVMSAIKE